MRKLVLAGGIAVAVVILAAFEPWTAWTRSTVIEALPTSRPTVSAAPVPGGAPSAIPAAQQIEEAEPVEPVVLASGRFVTQEHGTSGKASLLRLADGRRIVRLEGFSTSNGPDLHVRLSDRTAGGSWFKYDEGRSVQLGELTATAGTHHYEVPAGADLDGFRSVVIWCKRFSVAFGSAPLDL